MNQEWQPIETAPKDGVDILLVSPTGEQFVAWFDHYQAEWIFGNGTWDYVDAPTHWMPLPQPPTK